MGHGRVMSTKLMRLAYNYCCLRDGEKCFVCGWAYSMESTEVQRKYPFAGTQALELNHIDGNAHNNPPDGSNWNLLCKTCNKRWNGMKVEERGGRGNAEGNRDKVIHKIEDFVDEVERAEMRSGTQRIKQQIPFKEGEVTMQANAYYEPAYRKYVLRKVIDLKKVSFDDLKYGGAEVVGCAARIAEGYLKKLTSIEGALQVVVEEGEKMVILRQQKQ